MLNNVLLTVCLDVTQNKISQSNMTIKIFCISNMKIIMVFMIFMINVHIKVVNTVKISKSFSTQSFTMIS